MKWTDQKDQQLLVCVEEAEPLREVYSEHYTQREWWSTVAGLMLARHGYICTGGSCRTRFNRLTYAQRHEPQPVPDEIDTNAVDPGSGWDDVIKRVGDWEQDWHDRTSDDLNAMASRIRRIESLVLAMVEEWGTDL